VPQNSPLCWFASALNQIWKTLPDPSSPPALDLCQLEDRLLYSASPLAIIATDTTNGSWFYSTDSGTAWNSLNAVSPTSSRVLLADGNTRVYFQPNADYQGAIANAITFRAWDQGDGSANGGAGIDASTNGGGTAFSSATDTVSITISNGNDAPVLDNSGTTSLTDINENDFDPTGDTVAALVATELPTLIRLRSRELL
jgi:hypothetical protein